MSDTAAKKDIQKLQRAIVDGLEDIKAHDIRVFDTEHLSPLFERVIVASGNSNRQTQALAASVRDKVRDAGFAKPRVEGQENGEWIIIDCGAAVAHVMQPLIRQYYNLEEIWGDKPVRMRLAGAAVRKSAVRKAAAEAEAAQAATAKKAPARKAAAKAAPAKAPAAAKKATAAKKAPAKKVPAKRAVADKTAAPSPARKVARPAAGASPARKSAPRKTAAPRAPAAQKVLVVGKPVTAAKKAAPARKSAARPAR